MHKRQYLGAAALIVLLAALWLFIQGLSGGERLESGLTITALPVGKADALILQEGDTAVLIDTGYEDNGAYLLAELEKRGIESLDLLLVTHFDKDHVGSASYIVDQMEVDTVWMPDYEGDREEYARFLESLEGHPDAARLTEPVQRQFGELSVTVYPAENPEEIQDTDGEYDNDMSLVASVSYGERRFLFTGDIEKTRIRQMLASDVDWSHDWIKMPHHGRYQKALKELMDVVQPSWAVICCSEDEPAEDKTLELLKEKGIPFWDTADTAVVTGCDGSRISIWRGRQITEPLDFPGS